MLRLMLLRHAKSDRPAGVADLDRPLNPRGREAAPRMGAYLAAQGLRPDRVLVSPSLRTRQTWDAAAAALGGPEADIVAAIYEAPEQALLGVIRESPAEATTLLLVGHNPGIQAMATMLAGEGPRDALARLGTEFPTAALAVIDFDAIAWAEVGKGSGRLERFVTPKGIARDEAA